MTTPAVFAWAVALNLLNILDLLLTHLALLAGVEEASPIVRLAIHAWPEYWGAAKIGIVLIGSLLFMLAPHRLRWVRTAGWVVLAVYAAAVAWSLVNLSALGLLL